MKKAEVAQKSNPIFAVLTRVKTKQVEADDALFKAATLKTSQNAQDYYLINLPNDQGDFSDLPVINHHISVYKKYRDNHFGLSAYHYTLTFSNRGERLYLHAYFDQYGVLLDLLTQNEKKETLALDHTTVTALKNISLSSTNHIMAQIFNLIDKLTSQHNNELQTINKEIDRLSKIVFSNSPNNDALRTAFQQYMKQVRKYIAEQKKLNEISCEPDFATLKFLERIQNDLKLPETAQKATEQPSKPKPRTSITPTIEEQTPDSIIPAESKQVVSAPKVMILCDPEEEQRAIAQKNLEEAIKLDQGKTSPSSICHLHRLILDCMSQWKYFSANKALDICILQNRVLAKAKICLKMVASRDDLDSTKMLLPLVSVISQDLIESTALSGSANALSLLLEKYRGPRYFLYQIKIHSPEEYATKNKNELSTLSTLLHTENDLPNACLEILLNYGCDPESLTLSGYTLLQRAVEMQNLERVKVLLRAGVDVNRQQLKAEFCGAFQIRSSDKKRVARAGFQRAVNEINHILPDSGLTAVMMAAQHGDMAILKCLVEHRCDLGIVNHRGFTALGYGLISSEHRKHIPINEAVVQYLVVDCGLDIDLPQGPEGTKQTALHFAVQYGNLENARILLKYGANPNIRRPYAEPTQRMSSFFSACVRNHFDIAALILTQSKIPVSSEEIQYIIEYTNGTQPDILDKLFELLSSAPYIKIRSITSNNDHGIYVEYLDDVAARIRAGLPLEMIEEQETVVESRDSSII